MENLLVLRFSNLVFQPLWSRNYIRNVQLIFSEDFGAEGRGRLVQYLLFSILLKLFHSFWYSPRISLIVIDTNIASMH